MALSKWACRAAASAPPSAAAPPCAACNAKQQLAPVAHMPATLLLISAIHTRVRSQSGRFCVSPTFGVLPCGKAQRGLATAGHTSSLKCASMHRPVSKGGEFHHRKTLCCMLTWTMASRLNWLRDLWKLVWRSVMWREMWSLYSPMWRRTYAKSRISCRLGLASGSFLIRASTSCFRSLL